MLDYLDCAYAASSRDAGIDQVQGLAGNSSLQDSSLDHSTMNLKANVGGAGDADNGSAGESLELYRRLLDDHDGQGAAPGA